VAGGTNPLTVRQPGPGFPGSVGNGGWPKRAVFENEKTLTLSRDLVQCLRPVPEFLPIAEPHLLHRATTARLIRFVQAISADTVHTDRRALIEGLDRLVYDH
jgi:hypothetical protein